MPGHLHVSCIFCCNHTISCISGKTHPTSLIKECFFHCFSIKKLMVSPLQRFNASSACGAERLRVVHGYEQRLLASGNMFRYSSKIPLAGRKLDPKWVPDRKAACSNTWHEMKGPWRLSRIKHNPWNSNKQNITNLFSRRAFPMTPGDGVPDHVSPSQILLEMWIYAQEEVNTSEEQTKLSQMAQVKKAKSSKASQIRTNWC